MRFAALFLILHHYLFLALTPVARAAPIDALFRPDGSCVRSFVYRNRTHPVDSSRKLDAEGMRFVLKKSSEAEVLLNDYQGRLRSRSLPAYMGTVGLVLAVGGPLYAGTISSPLGQRDTRNITLFTGLFLAVAGYGYGQFLLKQKEKTLEKAIDTYNDAVPESERIRVDLMPLPSGTGGEIKTQVPF